MPKATVLPEPLEKEVDHTIEETRTLLPGVQALFGFQLMVVFLARFAEVLPLWGQRLHLGSLLLTAISIGLITAPAAYHRQAERGMATRHFVTYASRLIAISMAPLLAALAIEVALVTWAVSLSATLSVVVGATLAIFLTFLWFVMPRMRARTTKRIQKHVVSKSSDALSPTPITPTTLPTARPAHEGRTAERSNNSLTR